MADDLITVNQYPSQVPEIEKSEKEERRIGIDFTGLADLFFCKRIDYGSEESFELIGDLWVYLKKISSQYSSELGKKRGNFPLLRRSSYYFDPDKEFPHKCPKCGSKLIRGEFYCLCPNCKYEKYKSKRFLYILTQALTGSRSRMLGVSFGIEPHFALFMKSNILGKVYYTAQRIPEFDIRKKCKYLGINFPTLRDKIISGEKKLSDHMDNFVTTYDISPIKHLRVQAKVQKYLDQSCSKTINLPSDATVSDVAQIYRMAWEMKCKGITIYRRGSHFAEVISKNNGCPSCGASDDKILRIEGCYHCSECGASGCEN